MDHQHVLGQAQRLIGLLQPGDYDETLRRITAAAVEVLPDVQLSSITIRHGDGRLETVAPTHESLYEIDKVQYELQEGPCYESVTDEPYVVSSNLAADARWPRYTEAALAAGIRAQAGIALFDAPRSHGAMNLYSRHVGAFRDLGPLGQLFSHQAAVALSYAQEVSNLRQAISTRQLIGQAVGIVMERYDLDEQRAFAFLSRLSQNSNVKMRDLAQELVESRTEPTE